MVDGLGGILEVMDDLDTSTIAKFTKISEAMALMSSAGTDISPMLNGLQSIASDEFSSGLDRATTAIHDFAQALLELGSTKTSMAELGITETKGIPKEEMVPENELEQLNMPTLDMPLENSPIIIEAAPIAQSGGATTDMSTVEGKLDQLISLMKSGGIAVNLDGKKVNKGLAAAIESS